MMPMSRRQALSLAAVVATPSAFKPVSDAKPQGQITVGVHVSLAPIWMDPAQTSGIITPYMLLYALHEAMAKDMPGRPQAPGSPMILSCARACRSTTANRSPQRM
jgi:peptide/nickel transport system substrate-binding protein